MFGFIEWLERRDHQKSQLLVENLLLEAKADNKDIDVVRRQINGMFDDAMKVLVKLGKIKQEDHINQAKNVINDGYDWWSYLVKTMRDYPYKGPDLYDAATHLAGDLWENVFDPRKYDDRNPPLAVFHRMATIRAQDIAFRFFGWRRKLKTANMSDLVAPGDEEPVVTDKSDMFSDIEWHELQQKLIRAVNKEVMHENNKERAKRAVDVMHVKLTGNSKLYNKRVSETGLDALAAFYHVNRREMYDTLLMVYRTVREVAREISGKEGDQLLHKVMGQLPSSLSRDPEEMILSFIPSPPEEISHSKLFTKAYSSNRELKALTFKQIIQKLLDRNQIHTRKDSRTGKHQTLYRLAS
jgi:hypothetical protein